MAKNFKVDFIGIGASRSGTSWLANCLRTHPEICLSEPKEVRYFNRYQFIGSKSPVTNGDKQGWVLNGNYEKPIGWYANHFRHGKPGQIKGEYSPVYLYDEHAPARIKEWFPDAKLIVSLRNPIDRVFSHYALLKGIGMIGDNTFEEAIQSNDTYVERGFYATQLNRYLKYFSRDQLLILLFDDIIRDPNETLRIMFQFLGINANFKLDLQKIDSNRSTAVKSSGIRKLFYQGSRIMIDLGLSRFNSLIRQSGAHRLFNRLNTTSPRLPGMNPETREYLRTVYKNDIEDLESLIKRDLSHWK